MDAFVGDFQLGEKVRHIYTKRRGVICTFNVDRTRAAIDWRNCVSKRGYAQWKYVNVSCLERV